MAQEGLKEEKMIVEERIDETTAYHYSDAGMKIRQIETGVIYDEAYDIYPCPYTYEETDIPIEDEETEESAVEKLNILLGEEDNDGLHGDT